MERKEEKLNRFDLLLAVTFLLAAIGVLLCFLPGRGAPASPQVEVKQAGGMVGVYPLSENREILLDGADGFNRLVIQDGEVFMAEADCKNQYCVGHRPISHGNETIVCLPNRVVVTIQGGEEGAYDGISQ